MAGAALCSTAELGSPGSAASGDPTELALLDVAARAGNHVSLADRTANRRALFRFDPHLRLMTTIDAADGGLVVYTKGPPEAVMARATRWCGSGGEKPLSAEDREQWNQAVVQWR